MINRVGIMGTGAVGGMLCSFLCKEYSENFYVIGNSQRTERIKKGLKVNNTIWHPRTINCEKCDENSSLDLVIICTKNYDLESALNDLLSVVDTHTVILPLLNGVTATDRIKKIFPENKVLYGIVMRTDAARSQYEVSFSVSGEIQLGYARNEEYAREVMDVRDYLIQAGIPAKIYPDMLRMLWRKWMINIGSNPKYRTRQKDTPDRRRSGGCGKYTDSLSAGKENIYAAGHRSEKTDRDRLFCRNRNGIWEKIQC